MTGLSLDDIPVSSLVIDKKGVIIEISKLLVNNFDFKLGSNINSVLDEPYSIDNNYYTINNKETCVLGKELSNDDILLLIKTTEECSDKFKETLDNLSKEIIEPLNGIIGIIPLMYDHDNLKDNKYIKVLTDTSYGLMKSVNNIVDYSKLHSGKIKLVNAPFNIEDNVVSAIQILTFKAFTKNIKINVNVADSLKGTSYIGDSKKIQQILLILLANAIKYTKENKEIDISVSATQENASILEYSIRDSGDGIPEDRIDSIFKKSENKIYLGLAICQIMRINGWEIVAKTEFA